MYQRAMLANGLRIICETVPHVHSVSLGIWVGAGSRYEEPENNGISHFIEHMLFKGTTRRSAKQIAEEIDAVGGQLNAFTTKEYTCFYAKVLNQHYQLGLDLLTDMLNHSVFAAAEIAKEKLVVLEEIKSFEDSPDEIIHDIFAGAVLHGHPLGRPILGAPENIRRMNREMIIEYLRQYYTPDNIVLAVAGNVQFDQIVAEAERHLAEMRGSLVQSLTKLPAVIPDVVLKTKETEQVHICLGTRGVSRQDEDKFVVYLLDSILGGSVSSRLFQQLREERGLVYMTGSSHASFRDTGIFSVYAGTSFENYEQVVSLIKEEISKLKAEPISAVELNRAKEQLKGNLLLSLESTSNRMSRIAKTELFRDRLLTPEEIVAQFERVSEADLQRVARHLFDDDQFVLTAIGPFQSNSNFMGRRYRDY